MPEEIKNLPERPIDQLRRHETSIKLLEENNEDQSEVNTNLWSAVNACKEEIRAQREVYASDQRMLAFYGRVGRGTLKVVGGVLLAWLGWLWNHPDKLGAIENFFSNSEKKP